MLRRTIVASVLAASISTSAQAADISIAPTIGGGVRGTIDITLEPYPITGCGGHLNFQSAWGAAGVDSGFMADASGTGIVPDIRAVFEFALRPNMLRPPARTALAFEVSGGFGHTIPFCLLAYRGDGEINERDYRITTGIRAMSYVAFAPDGWDDFSIDVSTILESFRLQDDNVVGFQFYLPGIDNFANIRNVRLLFEPVSEPAALGFLGLGLLGLVNCRTRRRSQQ